MSKKVLALITVVLVLLLAGGVTLAVYGLGSVREVNTTTDETSDARGTTYYVDAEADRDDYSGTSPDKPLKTLGQVDELSLEPGDQVLFKKDCRWVGTLNIRDSGTKEAPIVFGMYGEGDNKPCIDGAGIVNAAVSGEDISFVEIRNLEVTNAGDERTYHRGISIIAVNQNVEGITIRNCYVHDVDSKESKTSSLINGEDKHWYGGIIVRARSNANPDNNDIILKDVLIENNKVDRCTLLGIALGGAMTSFKENKKCEGMVIRGNHVSNCWGDGIILFNDRGGLIEHNVAANNGRSEDMTNAYAGIWNIWSEDCLIQYNESYGQGPSMDGQGFDIDGGCSGTILQYNYSHDNAGGFLLCMQWKNGPAIIRYNVSVNDAGSFLKFGYSISDEPLMRLDVYNNTWFTAKPVMSALEFALGNYVETHVYSYFRNNIFCVKNGETPEFGAKDVLDLMAFENNCYYGFSEVSLPWNEKGQVAEDPKFTFAGSGGEGFDSLEGYKLMASSPCLKSGMSIYNNGGLDFWGNKIAEADMNKGAYMGEAALRPAGVNIALAQTAEASSFNGIPVLRKSNAAKLVDGNTDDWASTAVSEEADAEEWFEVALDDTYEISKVILTPAEDGTGYPVNFTITVCGEDGEWKEVLAKKNCKQPKDGKAQTYTFDKVSANKVRINISKLKEAEEGYQACLAEIELY